MIDVDKLWELYRKCCTWYDQKKCTGQMHYNQHVNDPRYSSCEKSLCPFYFWIQTTLTEVSNGNENERSSQ